jgi:ubiquinone/menaquinone biosynthesis C-methylase UbiE
MKRPYDRDRDREIELLRYDRRAGDALKTGDIVTLGSDGAVGIPVELRRPYIEYEAAITAASGPGLCVLDVCCGSGQHSLVAARAGAAVTVADISPSNVELAIVRGKSAGLILKGISGNAESLPVKNESFDIVTCAGGISYLEHQIFFREVHRILRPGGLFICVDSLNHNPVYRINRFVHYLCGRRTRSTLDRMPTVATISMIEKEIGSVVVSFHGVIAFAVPVFRFVFTASRIAYLLDSFDRRFASLQRFAFKFVVIATKPSARAW